MTEEFKMHPHQERARLVIISGARLSFQPIQRPLRCMIDAYDGFTASTEIANESLEAYRRMFPAIRATWLADARRKMGKRAYRRLRGKVRALNRS